MDEACVSDAAVRFTNEEAAMLSPHLLRLYQAQSERCAAKRACTFCASEAERYQRILRASGRRRDQASRA